MKDTDFLGDSLARLRNLPDTPRRDLGHDLDRVQRGLDPLSYKPMPTIGSGVYELRAKDERGIYRVFYIAKLADSVYVLHAFTKKTQKTPPTEYQDRQGQADRSKSARTRKDQTMTYKSVWDAIEPPDQAEHMKVRSELLIAISEQIRKLGLSPAEAAEQLKVKRPRVYELQAGKVDLFSLDKLVDYAAMLGIKVHLQLLSAA